jgi:D-alanyl-D-alanine dipeptidase
MTSPLYQNQKQATEWLASWYELFFIWITELVVVYAYAPHQATKIYFRTPRIWQVS